MSLWSRIVNAFRGDRLSRDIEEELESHIAEAIAEGRDPGEARRAFGPALHHREKSRDMRLMPWLESVYADAVFGRRQLLKRKGTSAAAIPENDDLTPGAHQYAVLSHDYWTRRFNEGPKVIGRTFRSGNEIYQIVGLAEGPFTGTESGTVTGIFVPTMMMKNRAIV
jgi:hypothetical protein